LFTEFIRLDSR